MVSVLAIGLKVVSIKVKQSHNTPMIAGGKGCIDPTHSRPRP
jgi:hypothetical protein